MVCEFLNTDTARKGTACGEVTSKIIAIFLTVASSLKEKLT
jgi:hypothetical protein